MSRVILDVARKELIDIARDKRAVFVMLVLPIALYPLLVIGLTLATAAQVRSLADRSYDVWVEGNAPPGLVKQLEHRDSKLRIVPRPPGTDALRELERGKVGAVIVVPPDLDATIASASSQARVEVQWHGGLDSSNFARSKVERAVSAWRDEIVAARLADRSLAPAFFEPVRAESRDLGPKGAALGRILAMLLVMMSVSGAFYPSSDLGAGEKEHGTLETLLVSPASRVELAMGKLLAIFTVALAAALANLGSLGVTFTHFGSMMGGKAEPAFAGVTIDAWAGLSIFSVLVPLVLLFSAIALLASTHAASYKEAQSYLTPVLLVAMVPSMATALPGIELTAPVAVVPVLGPAILIKELLGGTAGAYHVMLVVASSALYALIGVRLVARIYDREEVLFRPAAAASVGLFVKPSRGGAPTPVQALAAAITALLLVWFVGTKVQARAPVPGLVLTLVGCIAAPAVVYARGLGLDLRETFRLRLASPLAFAGALLLALGGVVLSLEISRFVEARVIGRMTKEEVQAFARVAQELAKSGPVVALLVFAALPAVCEELLFRGFVLSGLRRGLTPAGAAIGSAALFGIVHLDPTRLAHSVVLGVILAIVALRTRSLFPCALFHFVHNGVLLLLQMDPDVFVRLGLVAPLSADAPPSTTSLARLVGALALALGAGALALGRGGDSQAARDALA